MTHVTLHALAEQLRDTLEQVDAETGELPSGYESIRALVEHKASAIVHYCLESERYDAAVAEDAKERLEWVKRRKARREWLRRYLAEHMAATCISEIKDERGLFCARLEIGRDKSVDVFDEAQLPAQFIREKIIHEANKVEIRKALDAGEDVPGARIVARDRLNLKGY